MTRGGRGDDQATTRGAMARRSRGVVVDSPVIETDRTASRAGALIFSTALFAVVFGLVQAAWVAAMGELGLGGIVAGVVLGWLAVSGIHVCQIGRASCRERV